MVKLYSQQNFHSVCAVQTSLLAKVYVQEPHSECIHKSYIKVCVVRRVCIYIHDISALRHNIQQKNLQVTVIFS